MNEEILIAERSLHNLVQDDSDQGVWEVVLVSDENDRYNTKINPRGFVGTPSTTSIYYNHGGAGTGALLKNVRVETNYATGEFVNGAEVVIPECCVGEIHVPKKAQLNFRAKDGTVQSAGNLYEAMVHNHSNKVSVGFHPIKAKITENGKETIYNMRSTTMAKEFNSKLKQGFQGEYMLWELPELSVLDINSGQAHSKTKRIRSFETNNQSMSKYKNGDELFRQVKAKVMSEAIDKDSKKFYSVRIDEADEVEMDEDELIRLFGEPAIKPAVKVEVKDKEVDEETIKPTDKTNNTQTQRAWVNQTVKNKDGEFGLVTTKNTSIGADNIEVSSYTIQKLNGEQVSTDKIGSDYQIDSGNAEKEDFEWITAEPGLFIFEMMKKMTTVPATRSESEPNTNTEIPQPKANPDPKPSAEEEDQIQARKFEEQSTLSKLLRKDPNLLHLIEDEAEKTKYARSLNLSIPKSNPSKEPAAQFDGGEVSQTERAKILKKYSIKK